MSSIWKVIQKFGRTPDIDASDTNEDVWDGTGAYTGFLSAAINMTVSSTSTDDESPGTGAWGVKFFGLDENFKEVEQTLLLEGQSAVAVPTDLIREFRGYATVGGTDGVNAGDIWLGSGTVISGVPAVKYAGILAGNGQTLMAIYTIPANATGGGKIVSWYGQASAVQSAFAELALQTREFDGLWRTRRVMSATEGSGVLPIDLTWLDEDGNRVGGIDLNPKADIRIRVITNGVNNSAIEAGFNVELFT